MTAGDQSELARTADGAKVRHIDSGYVVLVGDSDQEISRRVPGEVYVALRPRGAELLFVPDEGNGRVELAVEQNAHGAGWQIRDSEDCVIGDSRAQGEQWMLVRGAGFVLDFATVLNDMVR